MSDKTQRGSHDDPESNLAADPWSDRVREVYRAPSLLRSQQVAFDLALRDRIAEQESGSWSFPLACGVAVAAAVALAWQLVPGGFLESVSPATPTPTIAEAPEASASRSEEVLLSISTSAIVETESNLPADYRAIDSLFFGE